MQQVNDRIRSVTAGSNTPCSRKSEWSKAKAESLISRRQKELRNSRAEIRMEKEETQQDSREISCFYQRFRLMEG